MSTAAITSQPTFAAYDGLRAPIGSRRRAPWAHPGVASERARRRGSVSRAEQAYAAELFHAEHHARTRVFSPEHAGGRR
jgi:hypothetical protein